MNMRANVVCESCNTVWMSQIENATKPILTPLLKRPSTLTTLTEVDGGTVALWAILKAIVLDYDDVIRTGSQPFFTPRQRTAFRDRLWPPDRCSVWLARRHPNDTQNARAVSDFWIYPMVRRVKHLHVFTMSIAAREFAIQVMTLRNLSTPKRGAIHAVWDDVIRIHPTRGVWSDYLIEIHPNPAGPVSWPPTLQLWEQGFNALAYRVSGGPDRSPYMP
jgi:hypothetical protein